MPSRDPKLLTPYLQECFQKLKTAYEETYKDREVFLTCTYRSLAEQQALYAQGRTTPGPIVTQLDGEKKLSKHNYAPARAFDVAIKDKGAVKWERVYYAPLGVLASGLDRLIWGGNWKMDDYPHFEEA